MTSLRKQSNSFDEFLKYSGFKSNKVMEIESIPFYRKIERPNLNSSKLKSITDQLQLEQKSKLAHQIRQANDDFIFRYDYNPFTQEFDHKGDSQLFIRSDKNKKKKSKKDEGKGEFSKMKNLIEEIKQHKNRFHQNRVDLLKMFRQFEQDQQKRSNKIEYIKNIQKQFTNASPLLESIFSKVSTLLREKKDQFFEQMDLINLLQIRQKNYYRETLVIQNIFKFSKDKELINNAGKKILEKYYFCHNSMKDIVQKGKIYIYRDISRFSRLLMQECEVTEDKPSFMSPKQLSPNINQIDEIDGILGISSGRIKPKEFGTTLQYEHKTGKEDDNSSTQQQDLPIDYPEDTSNFLVNKEDQFQAVNQARQFTNVPFGERQKIYRRQLNTKIAQYNNLLGEEQRIISLNIQDKGLKSTIEQQKKQKQLNLFDCRAVQTDVDRLIRKNKIFKDRCEELHVKRLVEVIKANKAANPKLKSRSKSKSKAKAKPSSKLSAPNQQKPSTLSHNKSPKRQK